MKKGNESDFSWIIPVVIGFCAVVVGAPRWLIATMFVDGFPIPASWDMYVHVGSGVSGVGMAIVEAAAGAYVMYAIGSVHGRVRWALAVMVVLMIACFGFFISPSIYARADLSNPFKFLVGWERWLWVSSAMLAPFATVTTVGLAQAAMHSASSEQLWKDKLKQALDQVKQLEEWNAQWQNQAKALQAQLEAMQTAQEEQAKLCPICLARGKRVQDSPQHQGGHAVQAKKHSRNGHSTISELLEQPEVAHVSA